MNRKERRERLMLQAKTAAALRQRAGQSDSAPDTLGIAQRLFQLGRSKEALPGLAKAVAARPDDAALRGALGYALAASGHTGEAMKQYRRVLELEPDNAAVLTNLAVLLARTPALDEARGYLERAAALAPEHANTAFALAELLIRQRRTQEAFHQYRRAVVLFQQKIGPSPAIQHCDDLVKLATAQVGTGDLGGGMRSLDAAIALRPDHAWALARRGLVLAKVRRFPEAIASLRRAAAVEPDFTVVRHALGDAFLATGDVAAAEKQFREVTRIDPGDELARYFLSAARHESPDAPPPAYIVRLFDDYAQNFERHLVEVLQYRAHVQVCSVVLDLAGEQARDWRVIDLGCGTGLNGPLIRRAAGHLTGVDLSARMLDKAREKSVYDELVLGDVAAVLGGYSAVFDLALCTDVMVYLGSLTPVFAAAARALKPGALFAFTTETHGGEGFVLDASRRYLHARGYVENEAASQGFAIVRFEAFVARYEHLEPDVHGLFVARLEASASDSACRNQG